MTAKEHTPPKRKGRKVKCDCGVTLDWRTQGFYCPPCRARDRIERKRRLAAAWERYHRRHSQPALSATPDVDVEDLLDSIDRLVRALEEGRFASARPRPTASPTQSTRPAVQPRGAGGLSIDDLGGE